MNGSVQIVDVNLPGKVDTFEYAKSVFSATYWLRLLSGASHLAGVAQNGRKQMEHIAAEPAVPQFKPDYWLQLLSGAASGNGHFETASKREFGFVEPMPTHWESELWLRLLSGPAESS